MLSVARCSGVLGYVLATTLVVACSGRGQTDLFDPQATTGGVGGQGGVGHAAGAAGSTDPGADATPAGAGGTTTAATGGAGGMGGASSTVGGGAGVGGASAGAMGTGGGASGAGGGDPADGGHDAATGGAGPGDSAIVDVIARDACVPTGNEVCDGIDNDCIGGIDGNTCPDGCIGAAHLGKGYMFCYGNSQQRSWQQANMYCAARGMHLVRVDDAQENSFIRETATRVNFNGSIWLGGSDTADEGRWLWTDGTPFWMGGENGMAVGGSYVNWSSNQPAGGTSQNCLELAGGTDDWHDETCGLDFAFVCEM